MNLTDQLANALRNIIDAAEGLALRQIAAGEDIAGAEIIQNDCATAREALAVYNSERERHGLTIKG